MYIASLCVDCSVQTCMNHQVNGFDSLFIEVIATPSSVHLLITIILKLLAPDTLNVDAFEAVALKVDRIF